MMAIKLLACASLLPGSNTETNSGTDLRVMSVLSFVMDARFAQCVTIVGLNEITVESNANQFIEGISASSIPSILITLKSLADAWMHCSIIVTFSDSHESIMTFGNEFRRIKKEKGGTKTSLIFASNFHNYSALASSSFSGATDTFLIETDKIRNKLLVHKAGSCSSLNSNSTTYVWESFSSSQPITEATYFSPGQRHVSFCRPVKIVTFGYEPFISNTNGFASGGIEVKLFKTIAAALNLSFTMAPPSDGGMWGEEIAPGNFTGLVGDLQNERADVGFADLFMIPNRRRLIDYTDAYEFEYVCFMMRKPAALPQWLSLVRPFSAPLWGLIILTAGAAISFMEIYGRLTKRIKSSYTFYFFGMMLNESQPVVKQLKSLSIRLFMIAFLFWIWIATNNYQGELTTQLSLTIRPSPIDTLEDLAFKSELPISSFSDTFFSSIQQSSDPAVGELVSRYIVHYNFDEARYNVSQNLVVQGEARMFLDYSRRKEFTNGFGETSMHIMRECLTPYQVAFALSKDNPLTAPFSAVIRKLKEAGFVKKWIDDAMDSVAPISSSSESSVSISSASPWTMEQLQGPFYLSFLVVGAALIALGVEVTIANATTWQQRTLGGIR